jgi:hypothetical protein
MKATHSYRILGRTNHGNFGCNVPNKEINKSLADEQINKLNKSEHTNEKKQTPWLEIVRELYRQSDRRLSVKLVSNLRIEGCRVVSVADSYGRVLNFIDRSRYFFFQVAPQLYS